MKIDVRIASKVLRNLPSFVVAPVTLWGLKHEGYHRFKTGSKVRPYFFMMAQQEKTP